MDPWTRSPAGAIDEVRHVSTKGLASCPKNLDRMGLKPRVGKAIVALQQRARAICEACPFKGQPGCQGAQCTRVSLVVSQIDSLVSEYFRLELEEKREALRGSPARSVWQRQLPFAGTLAEMMVQPVEPPESEHAADAEWHQLTAARAEVAATSLFGEAWIRNPPPTL